MITGKPLFNSQEIQAKVKDLADRITKDYSGKELLAVGILKGAYMFFSDLVRAIEVPLTLDFIIASSYIKTETSGEVKIYYDIRENIPDKHVLLIDDIVDTGITLNYIRERVLARCPQSVKVCAFLDKKRRERLRSLWIMWGLKYQMNLWLVMVLTTTINSGISPIFQYSKKGHKG